MYKRLAKTRKIGFTLVELLVVISIIALLLSILMPALGKARDSARNTICKSNARSMGVICQAYAAGNNGYFPEHTNLWPQVLVDPWNPVNGTPLSSRPKINSTHMVNLLASYVGDPKILYCPLTPSAPSGSLIGVTGPDSYVPAIPYGYHSGWNGGPNKDGIYRFGNYALWFNYTPAWSLMPGSKASIGYFNGNKKIVKMDSVSSRVGIAGDVATLDGNLNVDLNTYKFRKDPRDLDYQPLYHKWSVGGINFLYGDFHVERRPWAELKHQVTISSGPILSYFW